MLQIANFQVPEANFRNKRESWMLELPEKKTGNLVNPSKRFCTRIITDKESDRSVWTETPEEKQKKKSQTKEKVRQSLILCKSDISGNYFFFVK